MKKDYIKLAGEVLCIVTIALTVCQEVEASSLWSIVKSGYDSIMGTEPEEYDEQDDSYYDRDTVSKGCDSKTLREISAKYPGITVVDGDHNTDTIFQSICYALEAHEDSLIICHDTRTIYSKSRQFEAVSDYKYFWLDDISAEWYEKYTKLDFTYNCDKDEMERRIQQVDQAYRDIEFDLLDCNSEWDTAKNLYRYMINQITYDQTKSRSNTRNIYGALVEHNCVCKGYAAAFDYVLSRMGYQVGVAGNSYHIWNYMYWDSKQHFIDVTWGDPDTYDAYGNNYIDFSYFGMDKSELEALGDHYIAYAFISGRGYDNAPVQSYEYSGSTDSNYCDVYGYNVGCYSYEAICNAFCSQISSGEASLILKFSSTAELESAYNTLIGSDCRKLNQILRDAGYEGRYQYNRNDATSTMRVNLRAG